MAKQIIETITDDLDGSANATTVAFSFDGTDYTIDLTTKNKTALAKALKPYLAAATKVTGRRTPAKRGTRAASKRPDLNEVREWARSNGHTVSDRGRLSATVLEAYENR